MNDKPLTEKDFEASKLIVNAKYSDHLFLKLFTKWSYSDYLMSRWKMKKRVADGGLMLVCATNFNHGVYSISDECVVETDADNGKIEATDSYGDEVYRCRHDEDDPVLDETYIEQFEELCTTMS